MIDSVVAAKQCSKYLGSLYDKLELGLPVPENRYYAWRVPVFFNGKKVGEIFVGYQKYTGVIRNYSTPVNKIKERMNGS